MRASVPSFEQLGLLEQIKQIAEEHRGIILVAGSTGSGKSTTLAAMLEPVAAGPRCFVHRDFFAGNLLRLRDGLT